jgi:hypothetical protein
MRIGLLAYKGKQGYCHKRNIAKRVAVTPVMLTGLLPQKKGNTNRVTVKNNANRIVIKTITLTGLLI